MTSYRRTNEPRPLEVEPSTAGATGGGDHGQMQGLCRRFRELAAEIEQHRAAMADLGAQRRSIARQLNAAGWGYGRIADHCGVSKGLIQAMLGEK